MSELITSNAVKMTSLDIAALVGSRNADVKRSIERLAERGTIQLPPAAKVENKQSSSPNRFTEVFVFEGEQGKRDSIIVVAQLSPEFTARLVDRWQQLEREKSLGFNPDDQIAVLETLLLEKKHNKALEQQIEMMKPDVDALARIAKSEGSMCITDAAKALQMQPKQLFHWMQCNNWIYRRAGGKSWMGYQTKVKQQLLEHKVTLVAKSDGSEKVVEQVLVTAKGLGRLSGDVAVQG